MLNLTKRVDYGLIALTHLAVLRNSSGEATIRPSVREVAGAYHMSQPLLANVMKDLAKLGFVRSVRGTKGGYELSVAPEALSVGRVVEALEGPLRLTECTGHGPGGEPEESSCALAGSCLIKRSVWLIHAKIRDALYSVTLGDLARQATGVLGASQGLRPLPVLIEPTRTSLASHTPVVPETPHP